MNEQHTPQIGGFDGNVFLRIDRRFLPSTILLSPDVNHIYLIAASLKSLAPYCDSRASWLIYIAKLICEPHGSGELLTFQARDLAYWYSQPFLPSEWQVVQDTDELEAKIYEYRPRANVIALARISVPRGSDGLTSITSHWEDRPRDSRLFRRLIIKRDVACLVTGSPTNVVAARLIIRRLGNDNVKDIIRTYVCDETLDPPIIDRFDPRLGILLSPIHDAWVGRYELGFWKPHGSVSGVISASHKPVLTEISCLPPRETNMFYTVSWKTRIVCTFMAAPNI